MPSTSRLEQLRRWSYLLDAAFRIPGTNIRFGWDPIIGLVPGLGDLTSPAFAALVLLQAVRLRVPRVVLLRMFVNAAVDAVLGFVPVLGNIVDVAWKANTRNMALLERHAHPGVPPRRSDILFAYGVIISLASIALMPLLVLVWVLRQVLG